MFENFAGNGKIKDITLGMLRRGRLPHAIIIEGESGQGKTTFAKEFCKAVLCGKNDEYCDNCKFCTLFDAGTNPDFIVVEPDKSNSIKVDTIREVRKSCYERPDRCQRKVYLIIGADKMRIESQNAFLKILEEPPEYVVFVLLAESSTAFLETILSRCVCLKLKSPSTRECIDIMKKKLPDISEQRIESELGFSDNNIGLALVHIEDKDASDIGIDADKVLTMVSLSKAYECLKTLKKYEKDKGALDYLISHISTTAQINLRKICVGEQSGFSLSKQQYIKIIESCDKAKGYLKNNVIMRLVITLFCAEIFNK